MRGSGADIAVSIVQQSMIEGQPRKMLEAVSVDGESGEGAGPAARPGAGQTGHAQPMDKNSPYAKQLERVADELEQALQALIDADLVAVRRQEFWLEVEVRTDILFPSGVAILSEKAFPALDALAQTLAKYPNPVRVEGHTDDRPINTTLFPSNWELSSARAASVVHRFSKHGVSVVAAFRTRFRRVPSRPEQRHPRGPRRESPRRHRDPRGRRRARARRCRRLRAAR